MAIGQERGQDQPERRLAADDRPPDGGSQVVPQLTRGRGR
jgi:hypothetical protein